MSQIHYFQRYVSQENTITNNTLQLFLRIYQYSPGKASTFLGQLTDEDIEIGIGINQQERKGESVPDGVILQRSFKVLIETKVDKKPNTEQLVDHVSDFDDEEWKILMLLTKKNIEKKKKREIVHEIQKANPEVSVICTTFEDVCKIIDNLFDDYEFEIRPIVDDYINYCNDSELFDQSENLLRIVPCNKSIKLNKKYGIYYHPSDRGYTKHRFIGVYSNKNIHGIIEVKSIFDAEIQDGELYKEHIDRAKTDEFDDRILGIMNDAKNNLGHDIKSGHRFFCGSYYATDYRKSSKWGIPGSKFINLKNVVDEFESGEDLAEKLNGMEWE